MRVDVHTHVWPETIAKTVERHATGVLHLDMPFDNTVPGLKSHMNDSGFDKSVVMGISERPDQVARSQRLADRHPRPVHRILRGHSSPLSKTSPPRSGASAPEA